MDRLLNALAELPTLFIWHDRAVKVTPDGLWVMSCKGKHDNFRNFTDSRNRDQAVAGSLPGEPTLDYDMVFPNYRSVASAEKLDDDRVLFVATDGTRWMMTGDPLMGGRIDRSENEHA